MIALAVSNGALAGAIVVLAFLQSKEREAHRKQMTSVYERAYQAIFARNGIEWEQMRGVNLVAEARAESYGKPREPAEREQMPIGMAG